MKKQLSDEQLDQMMRQLLSDAALDDAAVNQVADSPTLWWAVQRQINRENEVSVEPWPPIAKFWRWLILAVPAATAAVVLAVLFAFQPSRVDTDDLALTVAKVSDEVGNAQPDPNVTASVPTTVDTGSAKPVASKSVAAKHIENKLTPVNRVARTATVARKSAEIKTDFIALSYARNPDSGQIVRVRVPSSMMDVGLVDSVENHRTWSMPRFWLR